MITRCRECDKEISFQAIFCPGCGAPYPAKAGWDGWGFEYKSPIKIWNIPLLHISFKYRANRAPVVAKGIIAIGQFGCGVINISQFGIGLVSISQFTIAGVALAQFALAHSLMAQFGLYTHVGHGPHVYKIADLIRLLP